VYGFGRQHVPAVLSEFQRCGEIVQWGAFGASDDANFLHLQFSNKWAAERALQRNGLEIAPNLIVGVRPIDARHKAAAEAHAGGAGGGLAAAGAASSSSYAPSYAPLRGGFQLAASAAAAAAAAPAPASSRSFLAKLGDLLLSF